MVGERDPKFYSELKQLNEDLLSYLKISQEKSPYFDFSPTLNDYTKQIEDLIKQYPIKAGRFMVPPSFTPTSSSSSFLSGTPFAASVASTTTNLGQTTTLTQAPTSAQPFIFGIPTAAPVQPVSNSFFSFSIPKKVEDESQTNDSTNNNTQADNNESADDDAPPPEPKIDKYEEPDAKYSVKCKLYEKGKPSEGESSYNLLGIGVLYVKSLDTPNKVQVIFRQEPDLRRVLLNEVLTPNIPVKLITKAVQMCFLGPSGETKMYIAKVKDEVEAEALYHTLNSPKA